MERWAANTLRTLGIILTAGFVIVVSLLLGLLAMCAAQPNFGGGPGNPNEAAAFTIAAVLVVITGIAFIAWLARGIIRTNRQPPTADELAKTVPEIPEPPLLLSPLGRKAIDRLAMAMATQILVSTGVWIFTQIRQIRTLPRNGLYAPNLIHNWIYLLILFTLYHIPYAILIYVLLKRPDRRAFSYSLAVPAVLIMQSLLSLGMVTRAMQYQNTGFLLLFVPWAIHIVIIVYAYQAIQQVGIHPQPSGLIVAAVVSLVFFFCVHSIAPILYRFRF